MMSRIAELQDKELVDISTGTKYGYISDLEINIENGSIENIVVYGKPRACGLLWRNSDTVFPWSAVKRIGSDLILVDGRVKSPENK